MMFTVAALFLSLLSFTSATCNRDNCLRALAATPSKASSFCATYTQTTNTATTTSNLYASACANNPSRVSSACSCVVTAPPKCTPSTVIRGPIRNGGFDSYLIPSPPADSSKSQPPWYYDRQTNGYGNFLLEGPGTYFGEGAAAFHLQAQAPGVLPGAVIYLNNPITYCNGTTYSFSLWARQNNTQNQSCRLSFFTPYGGVIGAFDPIPNSQFNFEQYGPVYWTVYRDNGPINAKGEYSDVLSVIVQCTGVNGQTPSTETLFEVDSVIVDFVQ